MQMQDKNKMKNQNKDSKLKVFASIIVILVLLGITGTILKQDKLLVKIKENENKGKEEQENIVEEQKSPIERYGIFGEYYEKASEKLETLTIEEKI